MEYKGLGQNYESIEHKNCNQEDLEYEEWDYDYEVPTSQDHPCPRNWDELTSQYNAQTFNDENSYEDSVHEEHLQIYEEYINETSEPIYNATILKEFWAGQEEVMPAKKGLHWQATGYATHALADKYDYY